LIRRLAIAALVLWVARWAALEIAMQIARRRPRPTVPPKDSPWPPGHMPGPFDD
jgi:hypothetical protein